MEVQLGLPDGLEVEVLWPSPKKKEVAFFSAPVALYEESMEIKLVFRASTALSGEYMVQGRVRFQACSDELCLTPAEVPVSFLLEVGGTPVYPMVPVTVAFFAHSAGHQFFATLGIGLTYSVLGAAALGGGMVGGWLRHPLVPLVLAGLVVLLGLSYFGLYTFRAPVALLHRPQWP